MSLAPSPPQPQLMPSVAKERRDYHKHPDFYFTDGSVILIVERITFRLHQTVLSRHSDVFAGMWDVPQPSRVDNIDGCPTVELSDRACDFADTLKAIYDSFHFDSISGGCDLATLITFVSGILRISTKYNMVKLRRKCISLLSEKFPSTLAGCDAVLAQQRQYDASAIVRIIPLARENNVPSILPWAYYLCTNISMVDLLANTVLSWQDRCLCLVGKERLWEVQKSATHSLLFNFARAPQCLVSCVSKLPARMNWREAEELRMSPHPLEPYLDWQALHVCQKCLAAAEAQHKAGREKVWELLPSFFQLGSWADIHKDQDC